ncbi:hypothetical protein CLD22_00990 [Rubrivivax gelatinosus]|nr:hypothetical protein [Rubrivivax gelatinosus]
MTVFDNEADRPSEFGDTSSSPSLWDEPSRHPDSTLESRRPRRVAPRRGGGGSLWPALLVVFGLGLAGITLLAKLFTR